MYEFVDDKSEMAYADLINPYIRYDSSKYNLDITISHENGYSGFTSFIGENLYQTP